MAGFWVQRVFPSVSTLIAALGLGGLIGLPITFWLVRQITDVWVPARTEALELSILESIQQLSYPAGGPGDAADHPIGQPRSCAPLIFLIVLVLHCGGSGTTGNCSWALWPLSVPA